MLGDRIRSFLEETSAHGLSHTVTEKKKERAFWIGICIAVYACLLYVTGNIVFEYLKHVKGKSLMVECLEGREK